MNFFKTVEWLKKYLQKSPIKNNNAVLYTVVAIPFLLSSLAIVGTAKYDTIFKNNNNFVDRYTENQSNRVLSYLNNNLVRQNFDSKNSNAEFYNWLLNQYLPEIYLGFLPQIAIVNSDGLIVANNFRNSGINSANINKDIWNYLQTKPNKFSNLTQPRQFDFETEQHNFFGRVTPWKNQVLNSTWYVVVIVPEQNIAIDSATTQNNYIRQYLPYLLTTILLGLLSYFGIALSLASLELVRAKKRDSLSLPASKIEPEEEKAISSNNTNDSNIVVKRSPAQSSQHGDRAYVLLANMSHELRSPLNSILGFVQIMEQELSLPQSSLDNVAIIHRSGAHLLSIINDIIDLAKIEIGRLTLEQNNIDFKSWLDRLEQNIQHQTQNRNCEFRLTRSQNLPEFICIDESRLKQTIKNLVEYSIQLSTNIETQQVFLEVDCSPIAKNADATNKSQSIHFEIRNPDYSVSRSPLNSLFDPVTAVKQKQQYSRSSSLDLPLSYRLARLMGGNITAVENIDSKQGIAFSLNVLAKIAIAEDVMVQPSVKRVMGLKSERAEYRILIVDDSKTNRKIMSQLLEPVGFKVREAVNGKEAVEIWLHWQPDLIWMDLRMPVMDGYEATEQIKSYSKTPETANHTPILALSASTLEEDKYLFKKAGCDDFVGKPFSENVIFEKIAQHLGIQYVYESTKPTKYSDFKLTADSLGIMPKQWLERLEAAAVVLDRDLLIRLLEEIPPEHINLKNALQRQIDNFDFDLILNLVSKTKNQHQQNQSQNE